MHLSLAAGALIGIIPIIAVLVLMINLNMAAAKAMPIGWLVAVILAVIFWRMPTTWWVAATLNGFLTALDILLIVFGAVLLYYDMVESGAVSMVTKSIMGLSGDRRVQASLGWLLVTFFEGAAGFGTPGAIVAPLLVGIGFPAMIAAPLALVYDSTPVSFGCVGIPVWGGVGWTLNVPKVQQALSAVGIDYTYWVNRMVGGWVGIINGIIGTFIPLLALYFLIKWTKGTNKDFREAIPQALMAGLVFTVPYVLIAVFIGSELPSLLGSLVGLGIFAWILKSGKFKFSKNYDFKEEDKQHEALEKEEKLLKPKFSMFTAFLPYLLIALTLVLTRTVPMLKVLVTKHWLIHWGKMLGTNINWTMKLANNPGLYFVIIVILSHWFFRMKKDQVSKAWKVTSSKMVPVAIALGFAIALSKVMILSGNNPAHIDSMLIMIAKAVAAGTGKAYSLVAPFIGVLGAYMAGSNTVSDIMFSGFQYETASILHISRTITLAEQVVGGAVGNMICVHNVVAVCATVGIIGKEGKVIKRNLAPMFIYAIAAGILGTIFILLLPHLF
ncbi:MAG: L-lactate permease [Nitrospiraceae bacterium]|nr:L-lactate permease [Nitrospiraceae bacterium]